MDDTRKTFVVTGTYQTESGNLGSFRIEIKSQSHEWAMDIAAERIKRDRRRRYLRGMDMSCQLLP